MKQQAIQRLFTCVFAIIILSTYGCMTPDTAGRNRAIESAVNEVFGILYIPTGPQLRLTNSGVAFLRKAEAAGLVKIREVPQGSLDLFFNQTQGLGRPFQVVSTDKLAGIALNPNLGGEPGSNPNYTEEVRISEAKIDKVISDEAYQGPLATPGEKYRLILGTVKSTPTPAAAVVGPNLSTPSVARFRCVVKYSEFKKAWSVIALDMGSIDVEQWNTNNVK